MSQICHHRNSCRLCNGTNLICVFELESTPPANAFIKKEHLNTTQPRYPLKVYFCKDCFHVQLLDIVNPIELFENYVYVSGTSPIFVKHFAEYAEYIIKNYTNPIFINPFQYLLTTNYPIDKNIKVVEEIIKILSEKNLKEFDQIDIIRNILKQLNDTNKYIYL